MCYAAPGPRCSAHAKNALNRASIKLREAAEDLSVASEDISQAEEKLGVSFELKQKRTNAYQIFIQQRETYTLARREYAGTPAGKAEYQNKLEEAKSNNDSAKVRELTNLLRQGNALAAWRQNALTRMREQGKIAVAHTKKYYPDGSLKLVEDGLGIITTPDNTNLEYQVGSSYSRGFHSADKLSSVTFYAYNVALDENKKVLPSNQSNQAKTWGYEVRADYVTYSSFEERNSNGAPSVEQSQVSLHYDDHLKDLNDAVANAKNYLENISSKNIRWDGFVLPE